MSDVVFVDTNVFVYLRDSTEPEKQRRCAEWIGGQDLDGLVVRSPFTSPSPLP